LIVAVTDVIPVFGVITDQVLPSVDFSTRYPTTPALWLLTAVARPLSTGAPHDSTTLAEVPGAGFGDDVAGSLTVAASKVGGVAIVHGVTETTDDIEPVLVPFSSDPTFGVSGAREPVTLKT
jgi:hypothetical protein